MSRRVTLILAMCGLIFVSPVLASGGTWKMGPFGPYWDDNDWPEFTPMYWMEEFLNRLNDDDDEIRDWMQRQQYSGQYPGQGNTGQGFPGQSFPGQVFPGQSFPGQAFPGQVFPGQSFPGYESPNSWDGPDSAIPYGWQPRPRNNQRSSPRSYPYESDRSFPQGSGREYSRSPGRDEQSSRRRSTPQRQPLPNLTPEEFSRMPRELQRSYKRAFDRELADYMARKKRIRRERSEQSRNRR